VGWGVAKSACFVSDGVAAQGVVDNRWRKSLSHSWVSSITLSSSEGPPALLKKAGTLKASFLLSCRFLRCNIHLPCWHSTEWFDNLATSLDSHKKRRPHSEGCFISRDFVFKEYIQRKISCMEIDESCSARYSEMVKYSYLDSHNIQNTGILSEIQR
jgi:hypothetical protein